MSLRNLMPLILAVGAGVGIGYYTFEPALREYEIQKFKDAEKRDATDLGENIREIALPRPNIPNADDDTK